MIKLTYLKRLISAVFLIIFSFPSYSVDKVRIKVQQLSKNKAAHNTEVIQRALEVTEPTYGPFTLRVIDLVLTSNREARAVKRGKIINATITPANKLTASKTVEIKVPIRLGLLSYRLLLINKADLPVFKNITSLEELKQLNVGLLHGWKTVGVYKENNIKILETHSYEGMFVTLNKHRFDYIPRGIYEIFDELDFQRSILENVTVEPTIALYIPTLTYVYVSPKYPRIANRLQEGLTKLLETGELEEILYKHFGKDIERANMGSRKIIKLSNSYYNQEDIAASEKLLTFH